MFHESKISAPVILSKSKVYLREDDIMVFEICENVEIEVEDMMEMIQTAGVIGEGKAYKNMIIAGKYASISNDAQNVMDEEESLLYTIAEAIVIQSLSQRILGNFYLKIVSKRRPARLFNTKEKAIEWLNLF